MWTDFRYWLADLLFSKELDEAHDLAIREGYHKAFLVMNLQLKIMKNNAPKSQHAGIEAALKYIEEKI